MKAINLLFALWVIMPHAGAQDVWIQKASFPGNGRYAATALSINDKGYMGLGLDDYGNVYGDFWEYDPASDTWSQKADFPGGARYYATGFSYAGKGYVGTGANTPGDFGWKWYKDMWEYDPASNTWVKKNDFAGQQRYALISFTIGDKVYAGTGSYRRDRVDIAHYLNDFWEYDPAKDTWTQKASVPEQGRPFGVGMAIGNKGYMGTGIYYYDTRLKDFWEYDPATDVWTRKADLPAIQRYQAFGFSIGNKGYITGGLYFSLLNDLWEYTPSTDAWTQKASLPGSARAGGISFSIGNRAYIGFGSNSSQSLNDLWQYSPSCNLSAGIADVYAVNPGGDVNTFYIGYGPSSLNLTATATGGNLSTGAGYTYRWSTGDTASSIHVSPALSGPYTYSVTVNDRYGCSATASKTIMVVDVRFGIHLDKVLVCHFAPGNPNNHNAIGVSKNAVAVLLEHGSHLGACDGELNKKTAATIHEQLAENLSDKDFRIYPNPSKGSFALTVNNRKGGEISLEITDVYGHPIHREKIGGGVGLHTVVISFSPIAKGVYWVRISGTNKLVIKKLLVE
ncbi:MAG: kelch repeat-containing protein [Flavisolibacter sp.]